MHDLDRNLLEFTPETADFEEESFGFGQGEWSGESGEVFDETELMELAAELLEIDSEEELNYFLGGLIKKAAGAVGKVIKSPVGQALGGILKNAARQALPVVGKALGGYVGGPAGAKIGGQLATSAGRIFGLETEGLSHEDEQFEVAKQYVRFAGTAVKNAVAAPGGNPGSIAQAAVARAAQQHAPGLLSKSPGQGIGRGRSGRWVRRGGRIILYGV